VKRLHEKDINTPEWFNYVWSVENVHHYDAVRLREFLRGMDETKRFLDVGAGWWSAAQYAVHHGYPGQYTAIDFSAEARRRTLEITPSLDYRIGDALRLPFVDGAFDVVACGELIEHMEAPGDLVAELVRVCRRGGKVIISTLDANCDAAKAHGDYPEHLWQWDSLNELTPLFKSYGSARGWVVGHYFMVEVIKR
jgi:2-polyprenyl-3-methyl-5-hydroxy-6-metoxy-1,4-benzoquinol methylase